ARLAAPHARRGPRAVGREAVRAGEPGRTGADDRPALVARRPAGRGGGVRGGPGLALHAEPLTDVPLQRPDLYRLIDRTPATGDLTRGRADPATDRGERVWEASDVVGESVVAGGDGRHVSAGVREHGACLRAGH